MGESNPPSLIIPTEINITEIITQIASNLAIPIGGVQKSVEMMKDGNTVPFIARYRKEMTGALNEVQLRDIAKKFEGAKNLEERKLTVLRLINEQHKLTPELMQKILSALILQEVEDLYLPFKPKLKTLGAKARERGLEPLANLIRNGINKGDPYVIAQPFVNPEKEVPDSAAAIEGAMDIIAEDIGSDPGSRQISREVISQRGIMQCKQIEKKDLEQGKESSNISNMNTDDGEFAKKPIDPTIFQDYFNFTVELTGLKPHQILAINRGEDLGVINVEINAPDEDIIEFINKQIFKQFPNGAALTNVFLPNFKKAIDSGYHRYIQRSIKREIRTNLRIAAEQHAIKVFATNLKNLLMTSPLKNRAIIGIDPGFRTGCKVAVIDQYGKFLTHDVIYPHPPKSLIKEAKSKLMTLSKNYNAFTFAVGNGTASRETEQFLTELIKEQSNSEKSLEYAIVDESGASIYSASDTAIEEFPNLDVTVRGAISIARRLQDPLAELIKIDPKSIGVGMYQHDVNQSDLKEELDAVIEDCVNSIGVDLNTASTRLLEYVSGLNKRLAKTIVETREQSGPYKGREQLRELKGLGPKAFEQSAGFLKIRDAPNPFDRTFVHPESYALANQILTQASLKSLDIVDPSKRDVIKDKLLSVRPKSLSLTLKIDADRIRFLVEQLLKPDLDPRDALPPPILRKDVLSIEDLKPGMIIRGIVRNVVDFGAFVDIGVKISGLVHKSELANHFVKNMHEIIAVGDVKDFMVISVDKARNRIGLSLKQVPKKENKN